MDRNGRARGDNSMKISWVYEASPCCQNEGYGNKKDYTNEAKMPRLPGTQVAFRFSGRKIALLHLHSGQASYGRVPRTCALPEAIISATKVHPHQSKDQPRAPVEGRIQPRRRGSNSVVGEARRAMCDIWRSPDISPRRGWKEGVQCQRGSDHSPRPVQPKQRSACGTPGEHHETRAHGGSFFLVDKNHARPPESQGRRTQIKTRKLHDDE